MESNASPKFRTLPAWLAGRRFLDLAPAALVALIGAPTITLYAAQGPHSGHVYWLTLALVENVTALVLLRRHPAGALAGILATFLLFDNPATMALPVAVALLAVASRRSAALAAAATAVVVVAAPILHRDSSAPTRAGIGMLAVALTAALGRYLGERRQPVTAIRPSPRASMSRSATRPPMPMWSRRQG